MAAYDPDNDDTDPFDDDEEELPVIPAPGQPAGTATKPPKHVRTEPAVRHGNTKVDEAPEKRRQTIRDAQGQTPTEKDEWRGQVNAGPAERSKAIAALTSKKPTHNAGSGFGLA